MIDILLKLESGQKLRLLPISADKIYEEVFSYYITETKQRFIHDNPSFIDFTNHKQVPRYTKYYIPVEYQDKLHFIFIGRKIKDMIDELVKEHSLNDPDLFIFNGIYLNVIVEDKQVMPGMILPSYDKCTVEIEDLNEEDWVNSDYDFWGSKEYTTIHNKYIKYINGLNIERHPKTIQYLQDNGLLLPQYKYLLRGIKINQFRQNKIDTTKTKLWESVIKMIGETSHENKQMEDIGYLQEDKNNEEVHQFMVDGYLFEVKLIDKVE